METNDSSPAVRGRADRVREGSPRNHSIDLTAARGDVKGDSIDDRRVDENENNVPRDAPATPRNQRGPVSTDTLFANGSNSRNGCKNNASHYNITRRNDNTIVKYSPNEQKDSASAEGERLTGSTFTPSTFAASPEDTTPTLMTCLPVGTTSGHGEREGVERPLLTTTAESGPNTQTELLDHRFIAHSVRVSNVEEDGPTSDRSEKSTSDSGGLDLSVIHVGSPSSCGYHVSCDTVVECNKCQHTAPTVDTTSGCYGESVTPAEPGHGDGSESGPVLLADTNLSRGISESEFCSDRDNIIIRSGPFSSVCSDERGPFSSVCSDGRDPFSSVCSHGRDPFSSVCSDERGPFSSVYSDERLNGVLNIDGTVAVNYADSRSRHSHAGNEKDTDEAKIEGDKNNRNGVLIVPDTSPHISEVTASNDSAHPGLGDTHSKFEIENTLGLPNQIGKLNSSGLPPALLPALPPALSPALPPALLPALPPALPPPALPPALPPGLSPTVPLLPALSPESTTNGITSNNTTLDSNITTHKDNSSPSLIDQRTDCVNILPSSPAYKQTDEYPIEQFDILSFSSTEHELGQFQRSVRVTQPPSEPDTTVGCERGRETPTVASKEEEENNSPPPSALTEPVSCVHGQSAVVAGHQNSHHNISDVITAGALRSGNQIQHAIDQDHDGETLSRRCDRFNYFTDAALRTADANEETRPLISPGENIDTGKVSSITTPTEQSHALNSKKRKSKDFALSLFSKAGSAAEHPLQEDKKPLLDDSETTQEKLLSMGDPVLLKSYSTSPQAYGSNHDSVIDSGLGLSNDSVRQTNINGNVDGTTNLGTDFQLREITGRERCSTNHVPNGNDPTWIHGDKVHPSSSEPKTRGEKDERDGGHIVEVDEDNGGPCGWGKVRSDFCQRFRDPRWFVVVITLCGACQGMAVNGFVNTVISTIERRFEINSTESGLIASCYDIMFVLLVIPVSYFGGTGHKPRYLGIGLFILGLGSFVFSLPHFISGQYKVVNAKETVCEVNGTSFDPCAAEASGMSSYKYLFFLGQMMHGAGATALYTLGVTYIDENVPQRLSAYYCGIFYTGAIIGPAIGYMAGAQLLNIYTDIGADPASLGLDTANPRWVGAWWIGFLLSGVIAVFLSLPLLAFPRTLPGARKYAAERGQEAHIQKSPDETGQSRGLKDVAMSVKLLVTNIPFMSINLAAAGNGILVAGFSTFMPKFIEYQFGITAARAALYVGLAVVPAGGGATFAGGFVVRYFDLHIRGILRLSIVASGVVAILLLLLLLECNTSPFAGVTIPYGEPDLSSAAFLGEKQLDAQCNTACGCAEEDFYPMCGKDGVMYFSPCYAGCKNVYHSGGNKYYSNCSCVQYNVTSSDLANNDPYVGVFGKCEKNCELLNGFMVIFFITIIAVFITSMPSLTATLRCIPDHQRSFGLGIQWIVARCFGSIPGPIMFGKMFDLACLVWQKRCDGTGTCFFYNNHNMSIYLLILSIVFSVQTCLSFAVANFFYTARPEATEIVINDHGALPHTDSEVTADTDIS